MRPKDLRLIRRLDIVVSSIDRYAKSPDCNDPFKLALVVQGRVLELLNGLLRGVQHLKKVRLRWKGKECEEHSDQHREIILKPLRDKAMEVEEVFELW